MKTAQVRRAGNRSNGAATSAAVVAVVLMPLRLLLAVGWLRAATEKLFTSAWWNGEALRSFLDEQRADALPFFRPVIDHVLAPWAVAVSMAVVVAQVGCGVGIISGRLFRPALLSAVGLNLTFMLAGRVNPSVFYLMMEFALLLAIAEGVIGSRRRRSNRWIWASAAGAFAFAIAVAPFVRTLDPSRVIGDAAMVLTTVFTIAGVVLVLQAVLDYRPVVPPGGWRLSLERWVRANPDLGSRRPADREVNDQAFAPPPVPLRPPEHRRSAPSVLLTKGPPLVELPPPLVEPHAHQNERRTPEDASAARLECSNARQPSIPTVVAER